MSNDYKVLKRDFDLSLDTSHSPNSFRVSLFRTIIKADEINFDRLKEAFPDEVSFVEEFRSPTITKILG